MAIEHVAAAEAILKYASLKAQNAKLAKENSELKREKRANAILAKAAEKSASLPRNFDLMKASEEQLKLLETALSLVTPSGAIKLGEAEEVDGAGSRVAERPGMTDLDRLLLDPEGYLSGEVEK